MKRQQKWQKTIRILNVVNISEQKSAEQALDIPKPQDKVLHKIQLQMDVSQIPDILEDPRNNQAKAYGQNNTKADSLPQPRINEFENVIPSIDFGSFQIFKQSQATPLMKISEIDQFPQVILSHNVPSMFQEGQIFLFEGSVNQMQLNNISESRIVTVAFSDEFLFRKIIFTQNLKSNSSLFKVQVEIPKSGNYQLSIFYGLIGILSTKLYTVISSQTQNYALPSLNYDPSIQTYYTQLMVKQNDLYLKIALKPNVLTQKRQQAQPKIYLVKFKQYFSQEVTVVFSNFNSDSNMIKIPYYKFKDFYQDLTYLEIYVGPSNTESAANLASSEIRFVKSQSFFATYHQFSEFKPQILQLTSEPSFHMKSLGMKLKISGVTRQQLRNQVVVLQPANVFKQYKINPFLKNGERISANSSVNLSFLLDKQGTYIIQINHVNGYAALNQPIYVGEKIYPLLPDFQDKTMRNYISHFTPQGKGPTDMAKQMGIFQQTSQNIALNKDIDDAHFRLSRSNIHLRNMVRSYWTRLGLGIRINSQNSYIIVQTFSSRDLKVEPITQKQLNQLKIQILNTLMSVSVNLTRINEALSQEISQYVSIKN